MRTLRLHCLNNILKYGIFLLLLPAARGWGLVEEKNNASGHNFADLRNNQRWIVEFEEPSVLSARSKLFKQKMKASVLSSQLASYNKSLSDKQRNFQLALGKDVQVTRQFTKILNDVAINGDAQSLAHAFSQTASKSTLREGNGTPIKSKVKNQVKSIYSVRGSVCVKGKILGGFGFLEDFKLN